MRIANRILFFVICAGLLVSLGLMAGPTDGGWGLAYPLWYFSLLAMLVWCAIGVKAEPRWVQVGLIGAIIFIALTVCISSHKAKLAFDKQARVFLAQPEALHP